MAKITRRLPALAASILLGFVACSSSQEQAEPGTAPMPAQGTGIALEIHNDLPTTVDCAIEAPGRPRRILGTVRSNSRETYIVNTSQIAAGFRVLCHRQTGQNLRSDPIDALSRAKITYTLSTGLVRIDRLDG